LAGHKVLLVGDSRFRRKIGERLGCIGDCHNESAGVALTFKHQLSQIEIKAKNDQDAYRYKVVAVRIES